MTETSPAASSASATPQRRAPSLWTLLKCFFRCYLVGAAFNTRGLQNVGLAFSMEPGLRSLYPDPEDLRRALEERYMTLYNTHLFWTPLLVGVFLSTEVKISRGVLPAETLDKIRGATAFTLSAIGDSFFGGSAMGVWALTAACLTAAGRYDLLAAYALFLLAAAQIFKLITFFIGYREGFQVLKRVKRWNLVNWSRRVKILNAALLAFFWAYSRTAGRDGAVGAGFPWIDIGAISVLAVWCLARPRMRREFLIIIVVAGGFTFAWLRI